MPNGSGIEITNIREVLTHLGKMDTTNKDRVKQIRTIIKKPFYKIRKDARENLQQMMATSPVSKQNLIRSLSVGSRFSKRKAYFSAAFGGRTSKSRKNTKKYGKGGNHFHLVNSGTKNRYTKKWSRRGAVGRRKTKFKSMNPNFTTGFADKAINANKTSFNNTMIKEFDIMYSKIKTQGV